MFSGAISIWKVRNALSINHVGKGVELQKKKKKKEESLEKTLKEL